MVPSDPTVEFAAAPGVKVFVLSHPASRGREHSAADCEPVTVVGDSGHPAYDPRFSSCRHSSPSLLNGGRSGDGSPPAPLEQTRSSMSLEAIMSVRIGLCLLTAWWLHRRSRRSRRFSGITRSTSRRSRPFNGRTNRVTRLRSPDPFLHGHIVNAIQYQLTATGLTEVPSRIPTCSSTTRARRRKTCASAPTRMAIASGATATVGPDSATGISAPYRPRLDLHARRRNSARDPRRRHLGGGEQGARLARRRFGHQRIRQTGQDASQRREDHQGDGETSEARERGRVGSDPPSGGGEP